MKPIFEYTDYRAFLRDFYEEKKTHSKSYSFRFFARKAGLNSPNYLKLVMDGERGLTHRNLRKFSKGIGLGEREEHFFENLVFFNQASDDEERAFFQKNLELIRAQDDRALLTRDQYAVLANWYPLVIKELILLDPSQSTPKAIAARLDHRITPQEAKDAIDLLVRLSLIRVDEKGGYKPTKQNMQTPDLARSEAVSLFHKQMLDLAKDAIDRQSSADRCVSALTVAVRKADLPAAFKKLHAFRNEMDQFLSKAKSYDCVYQFNLQLFRLDSDA